MITYHKRRIGDKEIRKIDNFEIGCWINVTSPTEEELDFLSKKFKLDKRNLLSGLDENELPRLDIIDNKIYVLTKTVISDEQIETFLIAVGENFILTLSEKEPQFIRKVILQNRIDFFTTQKLKSLVKILLLINEDFEKITRSLAKEIKKMTKLKEDLTEKDLKSLLEKENSLNDLVSFYYYMDLLYKKIIKKIDFFEQDQEIVKDLIEEVNEGLNMCKSSLKSASNIRNYYEVLLSGRLNKIMTILTIFTVLISLPAAISGIYGMNILLPLQRNPSAFLYIMGIISLTWIAFIVYLKKIKII